MHAISIAAISAAAITFAAPMASAQYYHRAPVIYAEPGYAAPAYYSPRGFYCVKECTQDTSPCDPPEFKRTDGRCTSPTAGNR